MYTISPGTGCKTHPCTVQAQDLLKMATQVASGMDYLAEKKITHRTLCARNVLVATGLKVKVYNYGPKADTEVRMDNCLYHKEIYFIFSHYRPFLITMQNGWHQKCCLMELQMLKVICGHLV